MPRLLIALGVSALLFGCPKPDERFEAVVGVVVPLTGPQAPYGVSAKHGIDLAAKEQNDKGGLFGRPVRLVYIDSQGDPQMSADAVRRLITQEQVKVIIGDVTSSPTLTMAPLSERARVPMITPTATNPTITEIGDHVFRVCFADPYQAEVMARFAQADLGLEKVAILRDLGADYSLGLADAFAERFAEMGGEVVANEPYQADDPSFERALSKVANAGAQAVYLPGYQAEILRFAKRMKTMKLDLVLLGADGWDTRELYEDAGRLLDGSYFTTHYASGDPRPEVAAFEKTYRAEMNEGPDTYAALGYDAARYALQAMIATRSVQSDLLTRSLASLKGFEGVTGPIQLGKTGTPNKPAVVVKVEKGERRFVARR